MKIGVVHPYPVHRRAVGGTTRVNALVRDLARRHRVTVFAHSSGCPSTDAEAIDDLAGIGVEQLLFAQPRPGLAVRVSWALGREPYFVSFNRNPELEAALGERARGGGFDVLHLEFAYLAPLLSGLGDGPVRVLAEQETMSICADRLRRVPLWRRTAYETYLATQGAKVRRFERTALASFSRLFAITPEEAGVMAEISGRSVDVLPHVVCTETFAYAAGEADESTVLFVGNYGHRPNLHGLLWFVDEVWPSVAEAHPEAVFEAVGPGLDDGVRRRLEEAGVRVAGRVEDLVGRYQAAAVFANPIRSGGGMRGKVLEAFSCGRPVVSTTMGMEGVAGVDGEHHLIGDDAETFAAQVKRYLGDRELRRRHGRAARALTERLYDAGVVFRRLEREYEACLAGRVRAG